MPPAFSSFGVGGPFYMLDDLQGTAETEGNELPHDTDITGGYASR